MGEVCPWPGCRADDYHDGEHITGRAEKPLQPLRRVQFLSMPQSCEVCDRPMLSDVFVVDAAGFGWMLCHRDFVAIETIGDVYNDGAEITGCGAAEAERGKRHPA